MNRPPRHCIVVALRLSMGVVMGLCWTMARVTLVPLLMDYPLQQRSYQVQRRVVAAVVSHNRCRQLHILARTFLITNGY
uniref:Putative secreted peptide n=1 Tax=Anopheles braziliensis TaxID=58242 RepID=A0A2M3ZSW1_9DIPT